MDDKCLAVVDDGTNCLIDYISFKELGLIYLLREDEKLIEKFIFRDRQGEKY